MFEESIGLLKETASSEQLILLSSGISFVMWLKLNGLNIPVEGSVIIPIVPPVYRINILGLLKDLKNKKHWHQHQ